MSNDFLEHKTSKYAAYIRNHSIKAAPMFDGQNYWIETEDIGTKDGKLLVEPKVFNVTGPETYLEIRNWLGY